MTNTQKKIEELRHKYYGANNPKIEDILIDVTKALQDTREEVLREVKEYARGLKPGASVDSVSFFIGVNAVLDKLTKKGDCLNETDSSRL